MVVAHNASKEEQYSSIISTYHEVENCGIIKRVPKSRVELLEEHNNRLRNPYLFKRRKLINSGVTSIEAGLPLSFDAFALFI